MNRQPLAVTAVLLCALAAPALAEDAKQVFQSLFGEEWKKVQATRDTADDLALAKTLLDAAKTAKGQADLAELLCNNAYTLASRDATKPGFDAAVDAMKLLAELVPDKAADANEKIVASLKARFGRAADPAEKATIGAALIDSYLALGDALEIAGDYSGAVRQYQQAKVLAKQVTSPHAASIDARIDAATQRDRLERRIAQLEDKVAADPANKQQRLDLIHLYVQLDKARAASPHARQSGDAELEKMVTLAAGKVSEVPVAECLKLGEWYRDLGGKAEIDSAKRSMLNRSSECLQRFIDNGKKEDLQVVKATLTIGRVKDDLAKLDKAATTATAARPTVDTTKKPDKGDEIDLIKLADPAKDATEGKWEKSGGKVGITIDSTTDGGWLNLPVEPQGDYEMNITFNRATGRAVAKIFVPITPKGGVKDRNGFSRSYSPGVAVTLGLDDGKIGAIENGVGSTYYSYYFEESSWKSAVFSRAIRFSNGKAYNLKIKVEHDGPKSEAKVTVSMGGEKYLAWRGDPTNSNVQSYRNGTTPAIAAYNTSTRSSAVFTNATLQIIDGEAKKLREEK